MKQNNISSFLGEQCRKYRKILGITQEELAEKMNTTPQTISNYERMGIKDVDVEKEISTILGVNLREETEDNEGTPGELGKEILFYLMEHNGNCLIVELLKDDVLYGITKERLDHEIEKIAKLDLCCRDNFKTDSSSGECIIGYTEGVFKGNKFDRLFITAKGIVTIKNLATNTYQVERINKCINDVKSYEMLLASRTHGDKVKKVPVAKDMEEFLELRPWYRLINELTRSGVCNYKADYIKYLYTNWMNKFEFADPWLCPGFSTEEIDVLISGKNFYYDLMYRMAFGFTNKYRLENHIVRDAGRKSVSYETACYFYDEETAERNGDYKRRRLEWFKANELVLVADEEEYFESLQDDYFDEMMHECENDELVFFTNDALSSNSIIGKLDKKKRLSSIYKQNVSDEFVDEVMENMSLFYVLPKEPKVGAEKINIVDEKLLVEELRKNVPNIEEYPDNVLKWFTKDQIESFIRENYKKPQYYNELIIQEQLHEIEKLIPEAKEEYYQFPKSWEENGLADLVREVCCLNM